MWSRTHGSHSHRFIPLLCVLNRSLVLSSVGSPIPLQTLSHGALLRVGLIPSVACSTAAAHYPSVVFLLLMRPSFAAQPMFLHVPVVYQHTLTGGPDTKQNILKSSSYRCCPRVITCWCHYHTFRIIVHFLLMHKSSLNSLHDISCLDTTDVNSSTWFAIGKFLNCIENCYRKKVKTRCSNISNWNWVTLRDVRLVYVVTHTTENKSTQDFRILQYG